MFAEPNAFLFSVQRALPTELPAALTGLAVDTDEKTLYIRCFFQGAVDREFVSYMQEAVWADFFPTIRVEAEGLPSSLSEQVPASAWVYRSETRELVHA